MTKIISFIGARPQIIRATALAYRMAKIFDLIEMPLHAGQHYSTNISGVFSERRYDLKSSPFYIIVCKTLRLYSLSCQALIIKTKWMGSPIDKANVIGTIVNAKPIAQVNCLPREQVRLEGYFRVEGNHVASSSEIHKEDQ